MTDLISLNLFDLTDKGDREELLDRGLRHGELKYFLDMVAQALEETKEDGYKEGRKSTLADITAMAKVIEHPHKAVTRTRVLTLAKELIAELET